MDAGFTWCLNRKKKRRKWKIHVTRKKVATLLILIFIISTIAVIQIQLVEAQVSVDYEASIIKAADWLASKQNADGGFSWKLAEPLGPSGTNVLGITAMGILKAHELEDKAAYETALAKAYKYASDMVPGWTVVDSEWKETPKGVDSWPDVTFLIWLAEAAASDSSLLSAIQTEVSGTTASDIADLARARWEGRLNHVGAVPPSEVGTTTAMAEWLRDLRHPDWDSLIPWDLEAAVKAALALDAYFPGQGYRQQAEDIADVIYACVDDTLGEDDSCLYFDSTGINQEEYILGLTGAIEAFTEVGLHTDKAANLKTILIDLQETGGYWNYYGSTPATMSVQSTAYAVMALLAQDAAINGGDWLVSTQTDDGGWYSEGGTGDKYLEIDSEATWAIFELIQVIGTVDLDHGSDGTVDLKTITIQQAIDAADPGDTVLVHPGTYDEQVVIDKSLTVSSTDGAEVTIINAQGVPIGVLINGAETVATFEGFTVDNYDTVGILAGAFRDVLQDVPLGDDPVEVHILNNIVKPPTIEPPHNNNIQIGDGTTGTVIGNEVSGALLESPDWTGSGILVAGSSNVVISNNFVHDSESGIVVVGYAEYRDAPAENNLIENNLVENNECGISVQMKSIGTIIRYNDVLNNDEGIAVMAIDYSWEHSTPSDTEIHYNNIVGNKNYGVISSVWVSDGVVSAEEVDATLNWWGDASGPTHSSNIGGTGDEISDDVDYSPWLGATFETTPRTFHVNPTGTIQGAINTAESGDTVLVHPGTYKEHITIDKSDLNLIGEDNETTIIDATQDPSWDVAKPGILIGEYPLVDGVHGVTVSGFTIRDAAMQEGGDPYEGDKWGVGPGGLAGIQIYCSSDNTIENNILINNYWQIWLVAEWPAAGYTECRNNRIASNVIKDSENDGVYLYSDGGVFVENTEIINNEITNAYGTTASGVEFWGWAAGPTPTITGTVIEGNLITGCTHGIRIREGVIDFSGTLSGNKFQDNSIQVLDDIEALDIVQVLENNIFDRAVVIDRPGIMSFLHVIYSYIQSAIDAALAGDTILVYPGIYDETITFAPDFAKDHLTISGDPIYKPVVTGGVNFQNTGDLNSLTLENLYIKGDGSDRIFNMANSGAVNDFTLNNCTLDGENVPGRLGIAGNNFGQSFTIVNTEFKNIPGWALMDINSGSGNGESDLSLTIVTFANNSVHDSSGSVALRGRADAKTTEVNVYGNTFSNLGGEDFWAAVEVNHAARANVYNNSVNNITPGLWGEGQALQFWDIDILEAYGNNITNCAQGIYIFGGEAEGTYGGPYNVPGGFISWNNIENNDQYGIDVDPNAIGDPLDARFNWWGDTSGPYHSTLNTGGSGNKVSDKVDFDPWLDKGVTPGGATSKDVPGSQEDYEVDAVDEADTNVFVNSTTGSGVTVAKYTDNPGAGFSGGVDKYIDVHVSDPSGVSGIEIRLYYTSAEIDGLVEDDLVMLWWDGAAWVVCSDTGVTYPFGEPTYRGYIWARITDDTTPSLSDLGGTPFGSGTPIDVWVDDDWTGYSDGDAADGHVFGTDAFATIQDAVNAVLAGSTIHVHPGTYNETVEVDVENLTIRSSEGPLATIVKGYKHEGSGWWGPVGYYDIAFQVIAPGVTIEGFTIDQDRSTLDDPVWTGFNRPAIMIGGWFPGDYGHLGVERVTIRDNIFVDTWSAIYIWKSSYNLIIGNIIEAPCYWRSIQIYDGSNDAQIAYDPGYSYSNPPIRDWQGNLLTFDVGELIHPSKYNRIVDNEIAYGSFGGIFVGAWQAPGSGGLWTDNTGTEVIGNNIHDTEDIAIGTGFSSGLKEFSGNVIDSCGKGIRIFGDGARDTLIRNNEISGTDYGILLLSTTETTPTPTMDCANTTISGNTINGSSTAGIGVMSATGPITIYDSNNITRNKIGIQINSDIGISAIHIYCNNIEENIEYGVFNGGTGILDATNNWWGDDSGPFHHVTNPTGHGDRVSDNVLYDPWKGMTTYGLLRLETDPPVPTTIMLNGIRRNNWGLNWVKLEMGEYTVSFTDVFCFLTPTTLEVIYPNGTHIVDHPIDEPITVYPKAAITVVIAHFERLGNLRIQTDPPVPATLYVNGTPMNDWGVWVDLEPGTYTVSFEDIDLGFSIPLPITVTVEAGETTHVIGNYATGESEEV